MIRARSRKIATALAILGAAAVLTGCGSSNTSDPLPPYNQYPGQPLPGYPGGGACIPLMQGYYSGGQQAPLGFQANQIYFDGRVIRAGMIPGNSQPYGQVITSQGGAGGPYTRSGVDGTISMNIQSMSGQYGGTYNPYQPQQPYGGGAATTANATGIIQISQAAMQDILYRFGGMQQQYPQYPGQYPGQMPYPQQQPQTCVSGIAIDLQWSPSANMLYGGNVYLYMNNTQHGYKLFF